MILEKNRHFSTAVTMEALTLVITDEWRSAAQIFEEFSNKSPRMGVKTKHTVTITLLKMSEEGRIETRKESGGRYGKRFFRRKNGSE